MSRNAAPGHGQRPTSRNYRAGAQGNCGFSVSRPQQKPTIAKTHGLNVPGDADASILPYRMDSNELDIRMPEIGHRPPPTAANSSPGTPDTK
jgi:hypothetical protein